MSNRFQSNVLCYLGVEVCSLCCTSVTRPICAILCFYMMKPTCIKMKSVTLYHVHWPSCWNCFNLLRPSDAYMHQETNHHWFRKWLVAWLAPSHYLNQCWNIINWTLGNKLQWNLNRKLNMFIQENAFEKCRLWNGGHFVSAIMC